MSEKIRRSAGSDISPKPKLSKEGKGESSEKIIEDYQKKFDEFFKRRVEISQELDEHVKRALWNGLRSGEFSYYEKIVSQSSEAKKLVLELGNLSIEEKKTFQVFFDKLKNQPGFTHIDFRKFEGRGRGINRDLGWGEKDIDECIIFPDKKGGLVKYVERDTKIEWGKGGEWSVYDAKRHLEFWFQERTQSNEFARESIVWSYSHILDHLGSKIEDVRKYIENDKQRLEDMEKRLAVLEGLK
ncbi:MAG: hypothetical protein HZA35_03265 [Parcubacteria group bacterium]|nr:hypothetical protein [Parcubacteria group bacterium]